MIVTLLWLLGIIYGYYSDYLEFYAFSNLKTNKEADINNKQKNIQ